MQSYLHSSSQVQRVARRKTFEEVMDVGEGSHLGMHLAMQNLKSGEVSPEDATAEVGVRRRRTARGKRRRRRRRWGEEREEEEDAMGLRRWDGDEAPWFLRGKGGEGEKRVKR